MPEIYYLYDGPNYMRRNVYGELHDAEAAASSLGYTLGPKPDFSAQDQRESMVVSRMQARLALHNADLLATVEGAVALADPTVQIAWENATEFRRNSPTIAALQVAVNLSDTQVDDLFRAAVLITA